jgi:SAM-dependent methyltransferase
LQDAGPSGLLCACGESYPLLPSGGPDFLQGAGFEDFVLDEEDIEQRALLEQESEGVAARIRDFLYPLILQYARLSGKDPGSLSVLDCGCGNGLSVDLLRARGIDAWGIDAGTSRHQQWVGRESGPQLISADALRIPFHDAAFDAVLSSGLVEHIGIHEEQADGYRSRRLEDCDRQRRRFIAELVRITQRDGFIMLDHPNGAFPADFWHGEGAGFRWHRPFGDMLPRHAEIVRYFRQAEAGLQFLSLSPSRRLTFNKIGVRWYGRLFAPLMKAWLEGMNLRPFRFLARSCLNPYLVTIISRRPWPLEVPPPAREPTS